MFALTLIELIIIGIAAAVILGALWYILPMLNKAFPSTPKTPPPPPDPGRKALEDLADLFRNLVLQDKITADDCQRLRALLKQARDAGTVPADKLDRAEQLIDKLCPS